MKVLRATLKHLNYASIKVRSVFLDFSIATSLGRGASARKIITGLLIILDLLSSSVENGKHKLSMTMEMKEEWLSYRWFRRENSKFFLRSRSIEFEVGKCIVSWNVLRTSIIFLCLSLARELTSDFLCWLLLESFEAEAAASCSLASASLLR